MSTQCIRRLVTLTVAAFLVGTSAFAQTREAAVANANAPVSITFVAKPASVPTNIADAMTPAAKENQALAQIASEPSSWPRSYILGRGGLTFATRTAPLVGAEIGGGVAPILQVYGSFDWHRDISPSFVDDISDLISDIVGADVNYRFPTFTGIGGLKVIAPRGAVRPYGLGGFGYGRVNGTVEVEGEDVTDLLDEFGFLDRDDVSFNKVLFEVGGGISASRGRLLRGHWVSVSQVPADQRADQYVGAVHRGRCRLLIRSASNARRGGSLPARAWRSPGPAGAGFRRLFATTDCNWRAGEIQALANRLNKNGRAG